jgi:hypothetical protein
LKDDIKYYSLLKVPLEGLTPNLEPFISHSTDIDLMNNKKILDCYDYIFNKPFLMLMKTKDNTFNNNFTLSESFTNSYLYFYNIPFIINNTTKITLDNYNVNFILPLSTQQFFIANNNNYYIIDNNLNNRKIQNNEITQLTFNPAYDSFNGPNNNLINIFDTLNNYKYIIDIIKQTNDSYLDIFNYIINLDIYGKTTKNYILNNINNLFNYNNYDYDIYSHYALASDITGPFIYNKYNSGNKLTTQIKNNLKNISDYFKSYINNINSNNNNNIIDNNNNNIILLHPIIDLNIDQVKIDDIIYNNIKIENNTILINYNKKIKKNTYVEKIDNNMEKFNYIGIINLNTYDYTNNRYILDNDDNLQQKYNGNYIKFTNNNIILNYEIKYYIQIQINNSIYDNIFIIMDNDYNSYSMTRLKYDIYEIYSNVELNIIVNKEYNCTDKDYSNPIRIKILDIKKKITFNYVTDEDISNYNYYTIDENIYYPINYNRFNIIGLTNNSINIQLCKFIEIYYKLDNDIISTELDNSINPYILSLKNKEDIIVNNYNVLYYKLLFDKDKIDITNIIIKSNFNNIIYQINISEYTIEFTVNNISSNKNFIVYHKNELLHNYKIIDFKEYNYQNNIITNNYDYYTIDNKIFYKITNMKYFILDSNLDSVNITLCNFDDINPSYSNIIPSNILPSTQNIVNKLYLVDPKYYILCYNPLNNEIQLLKILEIKNLNNNINYHCWLYKNTTLKLITSNKSPLYSIYSTDKKNFYHNNNIELTNGKYYLLDNNLFNNNTKQLLKIKINIHNCQEFSNYIKYDNNLYINKQLYYKKTNNTIKQILYKNNGNIFYDEDEEYIDYTNINFPCIITNNPNNSSIEFIHNDNTSSPYIILNKNTSLLPLIGKFSNNDYKYESISNDLLIINNLVYITSNINLNINSTQLYKINVYSLTNTFHIYIWIIITNDTIIINNKYNIQPYYNQDYNITNSIIGYKYYCNNKHDNDNFEYELLPINYNSIFNINNNYIYNNIILVHDYDIFYSIVKYDKLFLEMDETIILDNNYFTILGLNIFNNYYELKLIKKGNNDMKM